MIITVITVFGIILVVAFLATKYIFERKEKKTNKIITFWKNIESED